MKKEIQRKLVGNLLMTFIVVCFLGLGVLAFLTYDTNLFFAQVTTTTGIIVVVLFVLGFVLPRLVGRKTGIERAENYRQFEFEKWQFHSLDRAGPWLNYIEGPIVSKTAFTTANTFYSEWLVVEHDFVVVNPGHSSVDKEAASVSYDLATRRSYAWDGCTPKVWFYWAILLGTPDWYRKLIEVVRIRFDSGTGAIAPNPVQVFWQLTHRASVVHDAFYQYLDSVPVTKHEIDKLLEKMLVEDGMPSPLARIYFYAVKWFGGRGVKQGRLAQDSPFTCETFANLYPAHGESGTV